MTSLESISATFVNTFLSVHIFVIPSYRVNVGKILKAVFFLDIILRCKNVDTKPGKVSVNTMEDVVYIIGRTEHEM